MSEIQSIAQNNYILHNIDAKKLYVQEPLFTANSGDAVYVGWRPDETVLWSGSASGGSISFSEPLTSFDEVKFYTYIPERGTSQVSTYWDFVNPVTAGFFQITVPTMTNAVRTDWWLGVYNINSIISTADYKSMTLNYNGQFYHQCNGTTNGTNNSPLVIKKVVGIGRKENA